MKRLIGIIVTAVIVSVPLAVSAHHHLKHDFYVYDVATRDYIVGAVVTVTYADGIQSGETSGPHGNVQFRLPGEYEYVEVLVEAEGYCSWSWNVRLGFRPHVGGKGIWLGLDACTPVSADGPARSAF